MLISSIQDGEPHSISVVVRDILDPSSFPIPSDATSSADASSSSSDTEAPAKSLGFTSISRSAASVPT